VLKIEVILGIIASSIAIIAFMARAYANIRRGRRVKQYSGEIGRRAEQDYQRLKEELELGGEISSRKRGSTKDV
jgi:hypothetical protein